MERNEIHRKSIAMLTVAYNNFLIMLQEMAFLFLFYLTHFTTCSMNTVQSCPHSRATCKLMQINILMYCFL